MRKAAIRIYIFLLVVALLFSPVASGLSQVDTATQHTDTLKRRPKIGLVLSGGGAKGLAHIGVLKYLEKAGIKPDYITGTSMGSIIGGLYAIGYSADELDSIIRGINWPVIMTDKIPLYDVEPLEKKDYNRFEFEFDIRKDGLKLPNGLIQGQRISQLLSQYSWRVAGIKNFDDYPIPFRCVASDLITGQQYIFKSGDLMTALRASMAIPSVFTPVQVDSMYLVDGGVLNNFPVDVCREMGADIIIGVNVSHGDYPKIEELNSIVKVLMTAAMLSNTQVVVQAVKNTDLLISPDMYPYSTGSFDAADKIIERGEEAGRKYFSKMKALADSVNKLGPPPVKKKLTDPDTIFIKSITVHAKQLSQNFILDNLDLRVGDYVTLKDVNTGLDKLIGTRFVDKITYELTKENEGYKIDFFVKERFPYKAGFSLRYDNVFDVGLIANITARNFLLNNSKWSFTTDISASPRVDADFYKTLGEKRKSAIVFNGSFEKTIWPIYLEDGHEYGNFRFLQPEVKIGFAYSVNTKNIFYAGAGWKKITLRSGAGIPELFSNGVNKFGNGFYTADFKYEYNSLDQKYFSNRGSDIRINASFNIDAYEIYDGLPDGYDIVKEAILIPDENYFKFGLRIRHYIPVSAKTFLGLDLRGNLITHKVPYLDHIFIGGTVMNARRLDVPFYGLDYRERIGEDFVTFSLNYRIAIGKLLNVYLLSNALYNGEYERSDFEQLPQTFIGDEFMFGYGVGVGINSFIGPVGVGGASNLTDNRWRFYINVGIPF
ncbi:MAG: BamA/TamA family outer membrane protein [Chlorobi bacterium]|nr:BamA/TamA family outer membrane protein [Chlorobiota bacterium]